MSFGSDDFKCRCGNFAESDGFFPCCHAGIETEPDDLWEGYYCCARCGEIYVLNHRSDEYEEVEEQILPDRPMVLWC